MIKAESFRSTVETQFFDEPIVELMFEHFKNQKPVQVEIFGQTRMFYVQDYRVGTTFDDKVYAECLLVETEAK